MWDRPTISPGACLPCPGASRLVWLEHSLKQMWIWQIVPIILGSCVSADGLAVLRGKEGAIRSFAAPSTRWQVCKFVDVVKFYSWSTPHCSSLLQPVTDLLSGPAAPVFAISKAVIFMFSMIAVLLFWLFTLVPLITLLANFVGKLLIRIHQGPCLVSGSENIAAGALSRGGLAAISSPAPVDSVALAQAQSHDAELQTLTHAILIAAWVSFLSHFTYTSVVWYLLGTLLTIIMFRRPIAKLFFSPSTTCPGTRASHNGSYIFTWKDHYTR